jgi:hypothetical protein
MRGSSRYSVFSIQWLVSQSAWQESGLPHFYSTKQEANPFGDMLRSPRSVGARVKPEFF